MASDKAEHKGWGGPGRGQGRTAPAAAGAVSRRNVTLDEVSVDILRRAGDGDLSRGIRLAAQLMRDETHGILLSQSNGTWQVVNGRQRLLAQLEVHGFATALTTTGDTVRVERDEAGEICVTEYSAAMTRRHAV